MGEPVSISIIVPVYEEEHDIVPNVDALANKLNELDVQDYELLVFLSAKRYMTLPDYLIANKRIHFFDHGGHNEIGGIFTRGIKLASKEYVGLIPPYNQVNLESLKDILAALKDRDMVVAYIGNHNARPWYRGVASIANTILINLLFNLNLQYYHLNFYSTDLVKRVQFTTNSHSAMVEAAVWMAKSGASLTQVPFIMVPHSFKSKSRAFSFENIANIFKTYARIFWLVMICRKRIDLN